MKERLWYACVCILCVYGTASRLAVTGPDSMGRLSRGLSGPFGFGGEVSEMRNTCLELWASACEIWSFLLCQGLCSLLVKVKTVLLEMVVMFFYYPQKKVKVGGCYE